MARRLPLNRSPKQPAPGYNDHEWEAAHPAVHTVDRLRQIVVRPRIGPDADDKAVVEILRRRCYERL